MLDDLDHTEMSLLHEFVEFIRGKTMLVSSMEDISLYRVYVPVDVEGAYEDLKEFAQQTKRRTKDVMVLMPRILEGKSIELWKKGAEEKLPDPIKEHIEAKATDSSDKVYKMKYSSNGFEACYYR